MDQPKQQLNVRVEHEEIKGRYANALVVTAQEREVVIDFISRTSHGGSNDAALVARVFLHHYTADELYGLLKSIRDKWESLRHGPLGAGSPNDNSIKKS